MEHKQHAETHCRDRSRAPSDRRRTKRAQIQIDRSRPCRRTRPPEKQNADPFKDLKERGIVDSWAQLGHLIESHDFPTGFYLGSNTRVWNEIDVDDWLVNRPTDRRVAKKEAAILKPKFRERYVTP
jgi:hypothetical protein